MAVSFLAAGVLLLFPCGISAGGFDYVREVPFTAEDEQGGIPEFEEEVTKDGVRYALSDVQVKTEEKVPVEETRYFSREQEVLLLEGEEFSPQEEMEQDGMTYRLVEVRQEPAEVLGRTEQVVSGYTDYPYPVSEAEVPQTKEVTAVNQASGRTESVTCRLTGIAPVEGRWQPNTVDIVFYDVDADWYEWNGMLVPSGQEEPLEGYEREILQSVGAREEDSRITGTYWKTEPYRDAQGRLCREAAASMEQFVVSYRASYEGKLVAEEKGTRCRLVYEGSKRVKSDTDFTYRRTARAGYVKVEEASPVKAVLAGIGIMILFLLAVGMLYLFARKNRKKERNGGNE